MWGEHHPMAQARVLESSRADSQCFMAALQMQHFFPVKRWKKEGETQRALTVWSEALYKLHYASHKHIC